MKSLFLSFFCFVAFSGNVQAISVKEVGKYQPKIKDEASKPLKMSDGTIVLYTGNRNTSGTQLSFLTSEGGFIYQEEFPNREHYPYSTFLSFDKEEVIQVDENHVYFKNKRGKEVRPATKLPWNFEYAYGKSLPNGNFTLNYGQSFGFFNYKGDEIFSDYMDQYASSVVPLNDGTSLVQLGGFYTTEQRITFYDYFGTEIETTVLEVTRDPYAQPLIFSNGDIIVTGKSNHARVFNRKGRVIQEFRWGFGKENRVWNPKLLEGDILAVPALDDQVFFFSRDGSRKDFSIASHCPEKFCGDPTHQIEKLKNGITVVGTQCGYLFFLDEKFEVLKNLKIPSDLECGPKKSEIGNILARAGGFPIKKSLMNAGGVNLQTDLFLTPLGENELAVVREGGSLHILKIQKP